MAGAAMKDSIGAVIVTHDPDLGVLRSMLLAVSPQILRGVVVDNASSEQNQVCRLVPSNFATIRNEENLGLGVALNQGVRLLQEAGALAWILTLDQDTIISPDYVACLLEQVRKQPSTARVGIITAVLPKLSTNTHHVFSAHYVYATGNLVLAGIFSGLRFREEFFIDQIDHDFCFQVRSKGYDILVYDRPLFSHEHGSLRKILGRMVRYETGSRYYFVVRNSTVLLREGRIPLEMYLRQLVQWGLLLVLCEGLKRGVYSFARGMRDALGWQSLPPAVRAP